MPHRPLRTLLLLLGAAALLAGCGTKAPPTPTATLPSFRQPPERPAGPELPAVAGARRSFGVRTLADGLRVPVQVLTRPGDERLFVVEQEGTVRVVEDGRVLPTPYLDLTDRVRAGGELGLLTAVFSPDGRELTTMWTDERMDTRVTRYVAGRVRAERDAAEELLVVDQPSDYENHKGGTLLHDPRGRLLLGLGDGGSAFDPGSRSQDPDGPFGKILRYEDGAWRPVARGLRNPYRMSLDPRTGLLWVGDVGQDRVEEVDAISLPERGGRVPNLGWAAYEGPLPVGRKPLTGPPGELVWPVAGYGHGREEGQGCSVTGGLVHRGDRLPRLRGRYVYGDFCSGQLWSLDARGVAEPARLDLRRERAERVPQLTSFAASPDGGVVATTAEGRLITLTDPGKSDDLGRSR